MIKLVIARTLGNDPEVHAPGCADIKRGQRSGKYQRGSDGVMAIEVETVEDAARWFWEDFLPGGCAHEEGGPGTGMTDADAQGYTKYLPCTDKLRPARPVLAAENGELTAGGKAMLEAAAIAAGEDPAAAAALAAEGPAAECVRCGHTFPKPRWSGVCKSRTACDRRAAKAADAASAKGLQRTDPPAPVNRAAQRTKILKDASAKGAAAKAGRAADKAGVLDAHLEEAHGPILTRADLERAEAEHHGYPVPAPYYFTSPAQWRIERMDMTAVAKTARVKGMRPCDGDGIYLLVRTAQGNTVAYVPGNRDKGKLKGRTMANAWADVEALGVPVAELHPITEEHAAKVRKGNKS